MKQEEYGIIILFIIVVGLAVWGFIEALYVASAYAPPVIAAFATVYIAFLNHSLAVQREDEKQQKKEKQENYKQLINIFSEIVRNPGPNDSLDTIHLYSWVVGSENVIRSTQKFVDEKDDKSLRELLVVMRDEIGLEKPSKELKLNVFPAKGHLKSSDP